jgi:hypothetical protein
MEHDESCGANPCAPGPGNQPVSEAEYMCSLGVVLQPIIDSARHVAHELGLRPYQVQLVWQQRRKLTREWVAARTLQLTPASIPGLDQVSLVLGQVGTYKDGVVDLVEVSPAQVNETTLRGLLDGQPWADDDQNDREFFYEIHLMRRCPGDPEPERHRFTLASPPYFDASNFEWSLRLKPQIMERDGNGVDQSVAKPKTTRYQT